MKNIFAKSALLSAMVLLAAQVYAAELQGRVTHIPDGDTITVQTADGQKHRIRFLGIDAPESKQLYGHESQKNLERMIREGNYRVRVVYQKQDAYKRIVGKVLVGNRDLNYEQVKGGYAWVYDRYRRDVDSQDFPKYKEAERAAQDRRIGLWSTPNPTAPWDWRKANPRR